MGDLLFNAHFPYVDVNHGGSVDGLVEALKHVLDVVPHDVKFIAGHHGPVVGVTEVRTYLEAIEETAAIVRAGMREGKSLDELTAAGLPEQYADYSWRFISTETWIETVWRSSLGAAGIVRPEMQVAEALAAAVANPDRPAADRDRDRDRRPAEVLQFFGIEPGMAVADLMAGSGYYTEILAHAVGADGRVICHNSPFVVKRFAEGPISERLDRMAADNVTRHDAPLDDLGLDDASLDAALMVLFYHDTYWQEVDRAAMNRQIYAALKPGGMFGVVDHFAEAGSGSRDNQVLHRIDAELVKAEILAAGFELADSSDLLRHPEDDRMRNVFDPDIRGETDRFIFKFRKPVKPATLVSQ
jgi:predicted methyltransferase